MVLSKGFLGSKVHAILITSLIIISRQNGMSQIQFITSSWAKAWKITCLKSVFVFFNNGLREAKDM